MELTTLGAFLRTFWHGAVSVLASDDMTCIYGNDGVLDRVDDGLVWQWFAMGIIWMPICIHSYPIVALLQSLG